ncbi:fimbrial protein [Cupriavidus sp. WS]|uniref:fimbrial protein n=1 Tax=Cupriavidus sp. WS TaxID=1312922 RepID=UPI00048FD78F|nr:fimbrial protein [Cupriavidus sp. WS]
MTKNIIRTLLATAALAAVATGAQASDGTINFEGEVIAQTCKISVNGTETPAAATVVLPSVAAATLSSTDALSGLTRFVVGLKECSGPATTASAFFEAGPGVDLDRGTLANLTTGEDAAKNVELALLDPTSGQPIKVGSNQDSSTKHELSAGAAELPYIVAYRAMSDEVQPGAVTGQVTYSIDYK